MLAAPDVTAYELDRASHRLADQGRRVQVVTARVGGHFPAGPERVVRQRLLPDGAVELLVTSQYALGQSTRRETAP